VTQARDGFQCARTGDWQPLEHYLRSLGARYARSALALSAWYRIANRFHDRFVGRAVEAFCVEPARLTAVLLVLGEYLERALAIIGGEYSAATDSSEPRHTDDPVALRDRELEQARLVAKRTLERSAARLEILSTTGHEFAVESGNIERLLALVARRLSETIGDGCSVRLISPDGEWLEAPTSFHHPDPEIRDFVAPIFAGARERVGGGVGGRVAASGIARLIAATDTETILGLAAPVFRPMHRMDVSSVLAIPLRSRDRTVGVISFWRSQPGNSYTIDDQHLAQDLADRAGLAIDNAALVATLEHRVTQRTAALEAANRELEAFSYSVSHDLRTPLRAMDGFSRILMTDYEARLDTRGQHYLQRIRAATQRMASLIDDLLNLARITQSSLDLSVQDVSALASDVVSELQKRDPTRAIPVHIAPGASARADAGLLRTVLENLLGNAWKFTAKHANAQIWFGVRDGAFYVQDTGAGFDMAYAEKLFVPFQRLHAVKQYEGSGVGLATVHRIVLRHGGRIWAEASVDAGATFFFTLGDGHGRTAEHPAGRG
jgi:signal transduction histidine kinase